MTALVLGTPGADIDGSWLLLGRNPPSWAIRQVIVSELAQISLHYFTNVQDRGKLELLLKMGELKAKIVPQATIPSGFSVKTPTATTSVRGSAMTVRYAPARRVTSVTKATVQPLQFTQPPSVYPSTMGSWTPGPPTAAPMTLLQGERLQIGTGG